VIFFKVHVGVTSRMPLEVEHSSPPFQSRHSGRAAPVLEILGGRIAADVLWHPEEETIEILIW